MEMGMRPDNLMNEEVMRGLSLNHRLNSPRTSETSAQSSNRYHDISSRKFGQLQLFWSLTCFDLSVFNASQAPAFNRVIRRTERLAPP